MRKFWIIFEWFVCEYVVLRNSSAWFADYAMKTQQAGYSTPQWIASVFFLLLFGWLFWDECLRRDERRLSDIIKMERFSTNILLTGIWTVISLSIVDYFLFHAFTGSFPTPVLSIIGLIVFVLGAALHIRAGYDLKPNYTDTVLVFDSQSLVNKGLYSKVRHPMYLGLTIILIATCITFGSVLGFLSLVVLYIPALMYRINVEEIILKEHFKEDYKSSFEDKKRLIPNLI